jgi:hypothetical protein
MKKIDGHHFFRRQEKLIGTRNFSSVTISNSYFENCSFGYNHSLFGNTWDTVSDSDFTNCKVRGCLIGRAVVRRCAFSNIDIDELFCRGAVFDQVVIRGKVNFLVLHGNYGKSSVPSKQSKHLAFRKKFYEGVDWALDISEVRSNNFDIRTDAIPPRLVRRDKETQFLVTTGGRELSSELIERLPVSALTKTHLKLMRMEHQDESILIAPTLDIELFKETIRDLVVLKGEGLLVDD